MTARAALAATAGEAMARERSFFALPARLLDRSARERVRLLHAWVRGCDQRSDDTQARLSYLRVQTQRALKGEGMGDAPFEALRIVAAECDLPARLVEDHLEAAALEARDWRPRSQADLLSYCYHSAGAVACLVAVTLGVSPDDSDTLDHASDLGMAFELAAIARDMSEDDAIGQSWLPLEWLVEMDVPPGEEMRIQYRERMGVLAQRLAALAEDYAASGCAIVRGMPFRRRWAVLTAANILGRILREVDARGAHSWDYRIGVPRRTQLALAAKAWVAARRRDAPPPARNRLWTRPR